MRFNSSLAILAVILSSSPTGIWATDNVDAMMGPDGPQGSARNLGQAQTRILLVHMIFMIITWLLLAPAAILVARFGRTFFKWYPHHRNIQIATMAFFIVGFALGIKAASPNAVTSKKHFQVGVAIFVLFFFQCGLGLLSHSLVGIRWVGFIHIPIGLVLFGLAIWNIETGFNIWSWNAGSAPKNFVYAWMGLLIVLYLAGFAFLPREIKHNREAKVNGEKGYTQDDLLLTSSFRHTDLISSADSNDLERQHMVATDRRPRS